MDEPTTGLDPAVRSDLWRYLSQLRRDRGVTVIVTTHLLEEAERADRLAILQQGRLVALGSPKELSAQVSGQTIRVRSDRPQLLAEEIATQLQVTPVITDSLISWETPHAETQLAELLSRWGSDIREVTIGRATLEDVYLSRTGHHASRAAMAAGGRDV
jgi:ABC-2 type transport system ATP-binding protein